MSPGQTAKSTVTGRIRNTRDSSMATSRVPATSGRVYLPVRSSSAQRRDYSLLPNLNPSRGSPTGYS